MNDEEIEIVAQELAKIGGTSWYPGRQAGRMLRVVSERYRDQARALIRALDNHQQIRGSTPHPLNNSHESGDAAQGGLMR
jgi:hypothetical protein